MSTATAEPITAERRTPQESYDYGRALRENAPLESHADWSPASDRPDPVALIEEQNENRIPWLVPVRRARMAVSAFTFYRGTARIMATDLADTPVSGIQTQICGDAHLANFGSYASPERNLVFDINDFDETLPGPWEWDVKRLAASLVIAGRHNALSKKAARKLSRRVVRVYRKAMKRLAEMRLMDIWYSRVEPEAVLESVEDRELREDAAKALNKARRKDSRHALDKLTEEVDGHYRIKSQPPLLIPLRDIPAERRDTIREWVEGSFEQYLANESDELEHVLRKFRPVEYAIKVVGVGSVGTRCSILLLEGRDRSDPLFLQIKEANASVLEEHLPNSAYPTAGERVVQGQRLMQTVSDLFLGWTASATNRHYYWRQLKDWKFSFDVDDATASALESYATIRGWTLARAHARSGDPIAIAGYLGDDKTFDKAITEFADRYADQNDLDYAAFTRTIESGQLEASELA